MNLDVQKPKIWWCYDVYIHSIHVALWSSKFLGVSMNTSEQSIIPRLLNWRKWSGVVAKITSKSGIKTKTLKYSAIAPNHDLKMFEHIPSGTSNGTHKSVV